MLYKFFTICKYLFLSFLSFGFHQCFSQQYDAELINRQTIIEASEGKLVETNFFEIQINNRNGDKYAEISIPFNKLNKVSDIDASISDNYGMEVKKLKKSDIIVKSDNSAISFFDDNYVKEFSLRNNSYPYTLKYSYRVEASQFIFIAAWSPVIDTDIPTREATLNLSVPSGYKINYNCNLVDQPKIDSISGVTYYSWHASYKIPIKPETYSPALKQFLPSVVIVPKHFTSELIDGSTESWESYGNWNQLLLNGLDDLPLSEQNKILSLTDSVQDEKEKIRILFHYLEDATRYILVSIKTSGHKPHPASYVAENKYGDCKALANYFKSCLSKINIKAYYTVINADEVIDPVIESFPSPQFNHAILFIPLKQDTLWVDCTSNLAFGYLGTVTQNRLALVMDNNASSLVKTPALSFEEVLETRNIKVKLDINKTIQADFTNTYRGDKYELFSYVTTELSESERSQYIRKKIVENGLQLDSYSIAAPERDKPEIKLKYTASSDQLLKEYGAESLLQIIPLDFNILEEPKKRKLPVQINYPVYRIDTIEYAIPDNYHINSIPKNATITSKYGDYLVDFHVKDQSVTAIKKVKINSGSYPLVEYQNFYNFILSLNESENSLYIALTNK
jgi:hypothetical protein